MRSFEATSLGIKALSFYAVLVLAFFAAPYNNLFFLLLCFLSVLGLFSVWWTFRSLDGVEASVRELALLPSHETHPLLVDLCARTARRFGVMVELSIDRLGLVSGGLAELSGPAELALELPAQGRGIYSVRVARLSTRWPLGLWWRRRTIAAPQEIVVYPRPRSPGASRGNAGSFDGELSGLGLRRGNLQPAGLREHRPGESLSRVHWKASARRRALVVKEWDGGAGLGFEVVLDRRCSQNDLEESLSILAWLAEETRRRKESLTLHTQDRSATFGIGQRPWSELLRFLAGATLADRGALAPASPEALHLPLAQGLGR